MLVICNSHHEVFYKVVKNEPMHDIGKNFPVHFIHVQWSYFPYPPWIGLILPVNFFSQYRATALYPKFPKSSDLCIAMWWVLPSAEARGTLKLQEEQLKRYTTFRNLVSPRLLSYQKKTPYLHEVSRKYWRIST